MTGGRLDVLVNNAGICDDGPLEQQSLEELRQVIEVNLISVLDLCRSAAVRDVDFTGGRWHIFMLAVIVPALASTPVVAGVWLWLAWAIRRGYAWAQPAAGVFFGLVTTGWRPHTTGSRTL